MAWSELASCFSSHFPPVVWGWVPYLKCYFRWVWWLRSLRFGPAHKSPPLLPARKCKFSPPCPIEISFPFSLHLSEGWRVQAWINHLYPLPDWREIQPPAPSSIAEHSLPLPERHLFQLRVPVAMTERPYPVPERCMIHLSALEIIAEPLPHSTQTF